VSATANARPEQKSAVRHGLDRRLEAIARAATRWSGSTIGFSLALAVILLWLASGPIFDFSNTWQLVVNTGTTIVTFLMVFLIQRAQNLENQAVQLKLDELVAALEGASNELIDVEELSEAELAHLADAYTQLAEHAKQHPNGASLSVEQTRRRTRRPRAAD
jgi:low affinity Fe/Cu permease